ncbi:hypothetical protein JCM10213_006463 [Rhodosporidiobolus nylandii]
MSSESSAAPKRALSASPPPAASLPSTAPNAKRVKLDDAGAPALAIGADPAAPAAAVEASTTTAVLEQAKQPQPAGSSTKPRGGQQGGKGGAKKVKLPNGRKIKVKPPKPGGMEEAAAFDIVALLGKERVDELEGKITEGWNAYQEAVNEWGKDRDGKDVEVRVVGISDHGDGLALLTPASQSAPTRLLTIPFTLPDELVRVHIHRHEPDLFLSHGDLLEILEKSPDRSLAPGEEPPYVETHERLSEQGKKELAEAREKFGARVGCRYFGRCSGCQYQPLSYEKQLELKRDVVRRAFANFSGLDPSLVPSIGPTLPSPLPYSYRTKLTPHFASPPTGNPKGGRKKGAKGEEQKKDEAERLSKEWELTIGFEQKGRKRILDIEECAIATKVINDALPVERQKVKDNIAKYKRGATLLLRDSLPPRDPSQTTKPVPYVPASEPHICETDHHNTIREQVGDIEFEQQAGSFFQNNNSILPSLLQTVKDVVGPRKEGDKERYLVDAYTGSGLFAISLADMFDKIEGVEIDKASIKWAKRNAEFNKGEGRGEVGFIAGKAEEIFKDIAFPPEQTTLIIDPPRKGCDDLFLDQLLAFRPATVVYVSCNVSTQSRDIGWLLKHGPERGVRYRIDSLAGADLFSQSRHVEGLAILRREA